MAEISIPIPFIGKIIEFIDKKLFLKYYQYSHSKYIEHLYTSNWHNIDKFGFSYKICLENIYKNDVNDNSFLMIKNNSTNKLENLIIKIVAKSIFGNYIQHIYIDSLSPEEKPNIFILNQIPFQELEFYKDSIIPKYNLIYIEVVSINHNSVNQEFEKLYPMFSSLINDRWDIKWDINWNLKYIEEGKEDLREYIYYKILNGEILSSYNLRKESFIKTIKYKINKFLTSKYIISSLFWILVWTNKIVINKNGYYQLKKLIKEY
ncbi:hypothetical protein ACNSOS_02990 [Aliarcobacter vitoriensis]|uniref:hypothetical protein n=1 Tax=Aliarcobacter vitoriensis TaxID=2011099 RepID=UPI003AAAC9DA